jgi:hypothetical protein
LGLNGANTGFAPEATAVSPFAIPVPRSHPTGSIYGFKDAAGDFLKENDWNTLNIESGCNCTIASPRRCSVVCASANSIERVGVGQTGSDFEILEELGEGKSVAKPRPGTRNYWAFEYTRWATAPARPPAPPAGCIGV